LVGVYGETLQPIVIVACSSIQNTSGPWFSPHLLGYSSKGFSVGYAEVAALVLAVVTKLALNLALIHWCQLRGFAMIAFVPRQYADSQVFKLYETEISLLDSSDNHSGKNLGHTGSLR
jgi:hypothetical protein